VNNAVTNNISGGTFFQPGRDGGIVLRRRGSVIPHQRDSAEHQNLRLLELDRVLEIKILRNAFTFSDQSFRLSVFLDLVGRGVRTRNAHKNNRDVSAEVQLPKFTSWFPVMTRRYMAACNARTLGISRSRLVDSNGMRVAMW